MKDKLLKFTAPSKREALIRLECKCGRRLSIGNTHWSVDIRGLWKFTCPCGAVFMMGPKQINNGTVYRATKLNKIIGGKE